jgi:hypothetical protein
MSNTNTSYKSQFGENNHKPLAQPSKYAQGLETKLQNDEECDRTPIFFIW